MPAEEGSLKWDALGLPENEAAGEQAPDFDARALGGKSFRLSTLQGSYVLLVPTTIGCGDCLYTLGQLAAAYPDYPEANLRLVILNLYSEDVAETWEAIAAAYPQLDAIWGVVDSTDFIVEYDIRSLGAILLVDPAGILVYRSSSPLRADELRRLLSLNLDEAGVGG